MPSIHSFLHLHLQSRLQIAELNNDINILRIYNDYLQELAAKDDTPDLKDAVTNYEHTFTACRKEIDDLRNELHLIKMKFASYSRDSKTYDKELYRSTGYPSVKDRFEDFSVKFKKLKKELGKLENADD